MNIISRINSKRRSQKLHRKPAGVQQEELDDTFEIDEILSVEEVPQKIIFELPDGNSSSVCSDPSDLHLHVESSPDAAAGCDDKECNSEETDIQMAEEDLDGINKDDNKEKESPNLENPNLLGLEKETPVEHHDDTENTDDHTVESSTQVCLQGANTRPVRSTVDESNDHGESSSSIGKELSIESTILNSDQESKAALQNISKVCRDPPTPLYVKSQFNKKLSHEEYEIGDLSFEESASNMPVASTSAQDSEVVSRMVDEFFYQVVKECSQRVSQLPLHLLQQIKVPVIIPFSVYKQLTEGLVLSIYLYIQILEGSSLLECHEQEELSQKEVGSCRIPKVSRVDPATSTNMNIHSMDTKGRIIGLVNNHESLVKHEKQSLVRIASIELEVRISSLSDKPNQATDVSMSVICDPGDTASAVLQRMQVMMQEKLVGPTKSADRPILWRRRVKGMVSPIPSTACSNEEADDLSWSVFFEDLCETTTFKLNSLCCCKNYEDSLAISSRQIRKQKLMEDYECVQNTNFITISDLLNRATKENGKYTVSMPIIPQDASAIWVSLDLEGCSSSITSVSPSVSSHTYNELKSMKDMKHAHFKTLGIQQQKYSIMEQSMTVYNCGLKILTACQQLEANHKEKMMNTRISG